MKTKSLSTNNHRFTTVAHALQILALGVLGLLTGGTASGAPTNFFACNLFPSTNSMYTSPQQCVTFPGGIIISNVALRLLTQGVVPPPTQGGSLTNTFGAQVEMDVSLNGGVFWQSCVVTKVSVPVLITNQGPDGDYTLYGTKMLQLNFSGGTLPPGIQFRVSRTPASTGETRIKPVPGGYLISSFFDVWLDVSTDFGGTWTPSSISAHIELKVDPALLLAVAAPRSVLPMPNGQLISTNYVAGLPYNPMAWCQSYSNGIVIKELRQKLFTNWWESPAFGQAQTNTVGSQLDFLYSSDGGADFTPMRAPATTTVTLKNVRGFMGRTTHETEMTQFDIAGGDLPAGVMIRESPTLASKGGNSLVPGGGGGGAGGGAAISSFFDVFTEISTDSGTTWYPATNGPIHMELRRISPAYNFTNNLLPSLKGQYASSPDWSGTFAGGIVISNLINKMFTAAIPPPLPGITTSHTFGSQLEFDLSLDGGLTFAHATAPATEQFQITGRSDYDGTTEYYDTEMTLFDIGGGSLPAVQIRVSPTKASLGRTTTSAATGGGCQIDSFFDIFFEVSTNGGSLWLPATSGPATMTLQPGLPLPVTITIQLSGTNVVLAWPNGTLQCSTNVSGVYTNVSSATSPCTNPVSGAQQFYRVLIQ